MYYSKKVVSVIMNAGIVPITEDAVILHSDENDRQKA
jgi:fructose-bisphosphate aldolase class 1